MVVVRDERVAARIRTMRLHGINRDVFDRYRSTAPSWWYEVVAPGFKYNLTDPAAAIGRVQLRRAGEMREKRATIAAAYDRAFADLAVDLPAHAPADDLHAWHLYVLHLRASSRIDRDTFISEMASAGVGCSVHFIPLHKHPYWRDSYGLTDGDFPMASAAFERVVSLPLFSSMTPAQVSGVCRAVRAVLS